MQFKSISSRSINTTRILCRHRLKHLYEDKVQLPFFVDVCYIHKKNHLELLETEGEKILILTFLIDFNGISICIGLFYAKGFWNQVHCQYIFTFFVKGVS